MADAGGEPRQAQATKTLYVKGTFIKTARASYKLGRKLGKGAIGVVQLGKRQRDNKAFALKILKKPRHAGNLEIMFEYWDAEVEAMRKVKHKNVLQLIDYGTDVDYKNLRGDLLYKSMVIVLELAPGGELFDILLYYGRVDEDTARKYFHQLLSGLKAIHDAGFSHRDLKPQNLLLDRTFVLKIADLGHAKELQNQDTLMNTKAVGTRGYHAPEQLIATANSTAGKAKVVSYNRKVDIFSCGVILFMLVTGHPPFRQALATDRWFKVLAVKKYRRFWKTHGNPDLSKECKDMIQRLLTYQPADRILLEEALEHDWIANNQVLTDGELVQVMKKRHRNALEEKRKKVPMSPDVFEPETPLLGAEMDDERLLATPVPRERQNAVATSDSITGIEPEEGDSAGAVGSDVAARARISSAAHIMKRGRGLSENPTISHIMRNPNDRQAPDEGRPSLYDFTPFVNPLVDQHDSDIEDDLDRTKVPEVSDAYLNLFNSHVIKDNLHPYDLFLPLYRYFQSHGGDIEFDADKFQLKIRKFPLKYTMTRPDPSVFIKTPRNPAKKVEFPDASHETPAAVPPKDKAEPAEVTESKDEDDDDDDDDFFGDDIEIVPDTVEPEKDVKPDQTPTTLTPPVANSPDVSPSDVIEEYETPLSRTEFVNIYVTAVKRKADGNNLITFYTKHNDISFIARKQLRVSLDELYAQIADKTESPYYDEEYESTGM